MQTMTLEQIRRTAPSVFAERPWETMSERYRFFPTVHVVAGLMAQGFLPVRAQQSSSRIEGKGDFTKHMLRFRHVSMADAQVKRLRLFVDDVEVQTVGISTPHQKERANERGHKHGEKRSGVGRIANHIKPSFFKNLVSVSLVPDHHAMQQLLVDQSVHMITARPHSTLGSMADGGAGSHKGCVKVV
jgi:hypothetical protein